MKTKITVMNRIGLLVMLMLWVSACEFLDQEQDNRTIIDSTEKIGELLVSAYPDANYAQFCEVMSDNADDKGPGSREDVRNREAYEWKEIFSLDDQDTPEFYWNNAYEAIAAANQALASIEELGSPQEAQPLRGEALIARAYAHYMLVSLWSKQYNPATSASDLGIPYLTEPETELLKEYERGTVKGVYDNIQRDLEEGLPLLNDNVYEVPKFHFNTDAANAFATRFYLNKGEWGKVIEHADEVLGDNPASELRDTNGAFLTASFGELRASFADTQSEYNKLMASTFSRWARFHASYRFSLNDDITSGTVNAANPSSGDWAHRVLGSEDFRNVPKFEEFFQLSGLNGNTGFAFVMVPLFTTEEVLLNRAEAYIMNGDETEGLVDINTFYSKKIRAYDPAEHTVDKASLTAFYSSSSDLPVLRPFYTIDSDKLPIIRAILGQRRVEFIHEGLRWFDIRRFGLEVKHEKVGVGNVVEGEDILTFDDPRKQLQVPIQAQGFGIVANPR